MLLIPICTETRSPTVPAPPLDPLHIPFYLLFVVIIVVFFLLGPHPASLPPLPTPGKKAVESDGATLSFLHWRQGFKLMSL